LLSFVEVQQQEVSLVEVGVEPVPKQADAPLRALQVESNPVDLGLVHLVVLAHFLIPRMQEGVFLGVYRRLLKKFDHQSRFLLNFDYFRTLKCFKQKAKSFSLNSCSISAEQLYFFILFDRAAPRVFGFYVVVPDH
jgi:hypothetical protein